MPLGQYVAASWAGMLPGTAAYVYLGSAGKETLAAAGASEGMPPLQTALYGTPPVSLRTGAREFRACVLVRISKLWCHPDSVLCTQAQRRCPRLTRGGAACACPSTRVCMRAGLGAVSVLLLVREVSKIAQESIGDLEE